MSPRLKNWWSRKAKTGNAGLGMRARGSPRSSVVADGGGAAVRRRGRSGPRAPSAAPSVAADRARPRADEPAGAGLLGRARACPRSRGERVGDERRRVGRRRCRRTRPARGARRRRRGRRGARRRGARRSVSPITCSRLDRRAEQAASPPRRPRPAARRRCPAPASVADVPTTWSSVAFGRLADAAHEQRDVGALAAAVGVQLVEDQEPQALGRLDQPFSYGPGEEQLEHHVVGEQDVRRAGDDRLALLVASPGRCTGAKRHRARAVGEAVT